MNIQPRKIALITGANRGIGFEIARQLSEHGVRVLLSGRNHDSVMKATKTLQDSGLDVEAYTLDVTQKKSILSAFKAIKSKYNRLDILINNAGIRIEQYGKQPSEQSLHQWRKTFATNLFGMIEVTTTFLPLIRKSSAGRIINVSSLLA
ncbi:MAG TPA: SDR family NAD(P)-dependent oxidoreductase, partial [Legionellaceae bacterium]|nr:SDR family NAD(P)-dependent oxidoreductase [Legionellaceae bacterium]